MRSIWSRSLVLGGTQLTDTGEPKIFDSWRSGATENGTRLDVWGEASETNIYFYKAWKEH